MAVEAYNNLPSPSAPTTGQPTLSGAIDASVTSLVVSSNTNAPSAAPFRCIIDDEIMYVTARPSTTWTVVRGVESAAASHSDGATVVVAGVLTAASLKNNPLALTTTGDLPYLNSSGNQARLAVGAAGTILTVGSGLPAWSATPVIGSTLSVGGGTVRSALTVFANTTAEYTASDAVAASLIFQKSRGTVGSEALVNSADVLGSMVFRGFDGNGGSAAYGAYAANSARIRAVATEAFDASGHGAKLELATVAVDSTTLTLRATLDDAALTLSAALVVATSVTTQSYASAHSFKGASAAFFFVSDASPSYLDILPVNVPAVGSYGGAELNQLAVRVISRVDDTTKYGNPVYQGYLSNPAAGGSQYIYLGDVGWEGLYSDAGALTLAHFYVWDNVNLRTMFDFPYDANSPSRVLDAGFAVYGISDKSISATTVKPLTKNTSATETWATLQIKPTFNTGGSNANTTVNVVDVDTVNTAVTGLTVNLLKLSYGATQRHNIDSLGQITNTTDIGATLDLKLSRTSEDAVGVAYVQLKARGTIGSEAAVVSGDVIGNMSFRGFDGGTYSTYTGSTVILRVLATENFANGTNRGGKLEIRTTAIGATSVTTRATIDTWGVRVGATVASRGTTQGTNQVEIYDGTAPVGTLTNGTALYSTAGELRVMDAAGNATLLSPHDKDGNWIHDEINYKGRRLRIDMERLLKAVDAQLGGGYVQES